MKVEIFDPAMCCSTGVCGPSVDPELTRIASAVHNLKENGVNITRYNLTNDPQQFVENEVVNDQLKEKGTDILPITLVEGEVKFVSEYPTNEELQKLFGLSEDELMLKPKVRVSLSLGKKEKE